MHEPDRWSPFFSGLEPLSEAISVPTATAWRRCAGFAERARDGHGIHTLEPLEPMRAWLARAQADLRLHLVLKVGGKQRSGAWLGIGAAAATPREAERRARDAACDLGEALDAWQLFLDIPRTGPRVRSRPLGLHPLTPYAPPRGTPCGGLELLEAMTQLSRRPTPLALSIEIRPSGPSATLLDDVQRTQRRMTHRPSRMPLRLAMLFDPIAVERAELGHRLHALTQEITAGQIRIRLHGPPPRSLLRSVLHDALGHDLGTEVRFAPGPPTPLTARAQPLQALLSILALGTDATDDDDARDPRPHRRHIDPDAIPF